MTNYHAAPRLNIALFADCRDTNWHQLDLSTERRDLRRGRVGGAGLQSSAWRRADLQASRGRPAADRCILLSGGYRSALSFASTTGRRPKPSSPRKWPFFNVDSHYRRLLSTEVARGLWTRTALNLHHAESHMLLLGRKTALERVEAFLVEMGRQRPTRRSTQSAHVAARHRRLSWPHTRNGFAHALNASDRRRFGAVRRAQDRLA